MSSIYNYKDLANLQENNNTLVYRAKKIDRDIIIYKKKYIEDSNDAIILGYANINNKEKNTEDTENKNLLLIKTVCVNEANENTTVENCFEIKRKKSKFTKLIGYADVGDNKYVGIVSNTFLPLLLLLLLAALLITFVMTTIPHDSEGTDKPTNDKQVAETVKSDGNVTNDDMFIPDTGTIEFAGYDLVYTAKDSRYILLENPESNDVYFTYTITNNKDGKVLLEETDLITPGTALEWDAYGLLPEGEHSITMSIFTYDMEDTSITYTPAVMDDVTLKVYE